MCQEALLVWLVSFKPIAHIKMGTISRQRRLADRPLGGIAGVEAGAAFGLLFGPAAPVTVPVGAGIGSLVGAYGGGNAAATIYRNSDQIFQGLDWYYSQPPYVPYP
jgi:hypothetical protein